MIPESPSSVEEKRSPRIRREIKTIAVMIGIYCRSHHQPAGLCPDCAQLLAYAIKRIDHCRFKEQKPACSDCPVHCFNDSRREQIRKVMRFAGPRMSFRHPILTIYHFLDRIGSKRLADKARRGVK
ncbi:nitrous oxide-stimulated promoter family protein [bacterium]|nr:nitrous oxide-stimulated promoter family protein [bacterium]